MPDPDTSAPLDERFVYAVLAAVDITEDEAFEALKAVLPLVREYAAAEYERGLQAGDYFARKAVARLLCLGELVPPAALPSDFVTTTPAGGPDA